MVWAEDINIDKETDFNFPDDFMDLEYLKQAVVAASKILDAYNGVFLADVVGLGKTYIAALLAQQPNLKPARKLFKKCGFETCKPFAHYKEDINSLYLTKTLENN